MTKHSRTERTSAYAIKNSYNRRANNQYSNNPHSIVCTDSETLIQFLRLQETKYFKCYRVPKLLCKRRHSYFTANNVERFNFTYESHTNDDQYWYYTDNPSNNVRPFWINVATVCKRFVFDPIKK